MGYSQTTSVKAPTIVFKMPKATLKATAVTSTVLNGPKKGKCGRPLLQMEGLIVILLYACKLAFLASSACIKIIELSLKNEARKATLRAHKIVIIMPAI